MIGLPDHLLLTKEVWEQKHNILFLNVFKRESYCYYISSGSLRDDSSIDKTSEDGLSKSNDTSDLFSIFELEDVFNSYCTPKKHEKDREEMDIIQFKQMCRELEIPTIRFHISACESIFRRAAQKYGLDKISFAIFREHIFKMIVHERKTMHDDLIELILLKHREKESRSRSL